MGLLEALRDPQFRKDLGTNAGQLGQSMSNTIAESATIPVDALAWLLRRGRIPIPDNPVGGSEWARQQGLTKEVPAGAPKMAGETLGLIAPLAGTKQGANALATALRQGGENLSKARTMNPQTGAIVWHGSPHKFDKFDASKIGTGEGAQAYGHGLYLAESPDVARSYLATGQAVKAPDRPTEMVARAIDASGGDEAAARAWLKNRLNTSPPDYKELYSSALKGFDALKPQGSSLYKVDLPDDQIAKMLDWDKPLRNQKEVINALNANRQDPAIRSVLKNALSDKRMWSEQSDWATGRTSMGMLDEMLGAGTGGIKNGGVEASKALQRAGIPGIRYLDGGSRGAGQGSSNFVVFPGNEKMLRILERNGQGLLK